MEPTESHAAEPEKALQERVNAALAKMGFPIVVSPTPSTFDDRKDDARQRLDYKEIFNHAPFPQGVFALNGNFIDCNDQFRSVFVQQELSETGNLFSMISNEDIPAFLGQVEDLLTNSEKSVSFNVKVGGNTALHIAAVRSDQDQKPLCFVCFAMPVVKLAAN
eukprot:TRINITY_DN16183_c0_g1_i1.p1 TRINITY_DN16183_c0_g1~~TRINITY_DN16183_c0_g1_i1.p1  ORF type:complete len:163 (-),score=36.02 TRINITY_DN16183_c0_g1_i1:18-506(-)